MMLKSLYMRSKQLTTLKHIIIILLFFGLLLGLRWVWAENFSSAAFTPAVNGVLDLRGWKMDRTSTVPFGWRMAVLSWKAHLPTGCAIGS